MAISLAILGGGLFAQEAHLPAVKSLGQEVILSAIYSRSEKTASAFAELAAQTLNVESVPIYFDDGGPSRSLDALLARDDIQAVIVCLPISTQPGVVLKSLAAGKHVLSEKPIDKDVASGLALIAEYNKTYKAKGLIWRVAEDVEAEPSYRAAGKAIRDGAIGKVLFWNLSTVNHIDRESKWYKTPWRTVPDYQGGFLLDGGVHSAAQLRVILPSPMISLTGFASLHKEYLAPHDTIQAIIRCADGSHGVFELSFAASSPSSSRSCTLIEGDKGSLEIKEVDDQYKVILKKGGLEEEIESKPSMGVRLEFESFIAAIGGKKDDLGDPLAMLRDVAIIEAALTSKGSLVDLTRLVPTA